MYQNGLDGYRIEKRLVGIKTFGMQEWKDRGEEQDGTIIFFPSFLHWSLVISLVCLDLGLVDNRSFHK